MASIRSSSRTSRSTRTPESLPVFNLYPSTINKDSKAQHVLGLSRTELQGARNESLQPKPTSRFSSTSPSDRSSIRNPFSRAKDKLVGLAVREVEVDLSSPSAPSRDSFAPESDLGSPSQATFSTRYPSTSTLGSFYDANTAPVRISQQTSNSSSRDFASRNTIPVDSINPASEMQVQSRSNRLHKPPKLRRIAENQSLDREKAGMRSETNFLPTSRRSSLSNNSTKAPFITRISVLSNPSPPDSPPTITIPEIPSRGRRHETFHNKTEQIEQSDVAPATLNSPYAKVHVRRPKAGTKHWFDDLEGMTSDEGEPQPFEPDNWPLVNIENVLRIEDGHNGIYNATPKSDTVQRSTGQKTTKNHHIEQVSELSGDPAQSTQKKSGRPKAAKQLSKEAIRPSRRKVNPLVKADLTQESVLYLSMSDDGSGDDLIVPLPPTKVRENARAIRKSLSSVAWEDSDVEFGYAHAVPTTRKAPGSRPSPIKVVHTRQTSSLSSQSPSTIPPMWSTPKFDLNDTISAPSDVPNGKDAEDVIISSFPATPTDANRPRSSTSVPDDKSIASMRTMKVTRQEENLIAAIRMKKAAMKRIEKSEARQRANKKKEALEKIVVPQRRSSLASQNTPTASPTELVMKRSPSPLILAGFSLTDEGVHEISRPATASPTCSYEKRSSETPLLFRNLDAEQLPPLSSNAMELESPTRFRVSPVSTRNSFGLFPRPQSFLSRGSQDSQRQESNIIVLDNLDSALPTPAFPPRLFMESPFGAWDTPDAAAVH